MASKVLYAPVIDSYMPAFIGSESSGACDVCFSLSKFNGSVDIEGIQVSIAKQGNGMTVINPVDSDSDEIYRSNGRIIIINVEPAKGSDGLYHFSLTNNDIRNGWTSGWVYKIQIRLSQVKYDPNIKQEQWLNDNASSFSEQSTVCVVKAIGKVDLEIGNPFNYPKLDEANTDFEVMHTYYDSTIAFGGRMTCADASEKLYSYRVQVYNYEGSEDLDELIEDSGFLYADQYQNGNEFYYFIKKEFKDSKQYKIIFTYETINGYKNTWKDIFEISWAQSQAPQIVVRTAEQISGNTHQHSTATMTSSVYEDEEEGRMALKLVDLEPRFRSGNYCIRRTDETSNFQDWVDIKIIPVKQQKIDELPIYYDYTINSGVYYLYAVQEIDRNGNRSLMHSMETPVSRSFQYSYLLGEGGKQLKLKFDNTMQSFKIQQIESKVEPIGNKHPTITRNAVTEYKIFPLAGLISFQMDDAKIFCSKDSVYGDNAGYHKHQINSGSSDIEIFPDYDFNQEKDFRKEVIKFLKDGKPKLFKSPTEDNIVVRLMDINFTPNQTLDRMIYSFTSNANEIAEPTMENYLKFGFYEVGEPEEDFAVYETKIGQLYGDFTPNDNIIKMIYSKYSSGSEEVAGFIKKIQKVYQIRITINDKPLRVQATSGDLVIGNNMKITGQGNSNTEKIITIYNGIYDFDSRVIFKEDQGLYLLGAEDGTVSTINACIDFLYDLSIEEYVGKKRENLSSLRGVGQVFKSYTEGESIYSDIYAKYYITSEKSFCELNRLYGVEIEANPGIEFEIMDLDDDTSESQEHRKHIINQTGLLRLYDINDIKEIRIIPKDLNNKKKVDVNVTYFYTLLKGDYKDD